ncbi:MAG: 2-oxo acid dehydrogenase subunit E2 [Alicyclobacillus macrosporangiidus]|uniref:dihydrolipoamide acetyltransferase family protein n=1 Tax=Alicyclobacillus macrosporangiidus TaxID=392015 RepID=UPI0026ED1541|nr:dihydrolipoamide acetyltransferase family protein [Alicyclobacillus macrosporangiidus]MCL6599285.1 2-oxo acid dehydrogenase subunit E2 [Alicyclobacillus macrosporangiidus]
MKEVRMPQTTDEPLESLVVFWYKSEGEWIDEGEALLEVQTEKATYDVPAPASGFVRNIRVRRGEAAPVGAVLAYIDAGAAEPGGLDRVPGGAANTVDTLTGTGSGGSTALGTGPVSPAAAAPSSPGSFVQAPPRMRRLAAELGVDLSSVQGTGPNGRITEEDVRRAADSCDGSVRGAGGPGRSTGMVAGDTILPLTPTRRTIARRMTESLQQSAQLTLTAWADVTDLAGQRDRLAPGIRWNTWVMRAAVLALRQHPDVNVSWSEAGIVRHAQIHLGMAVDTPAGLVVPVIREADQHSLSGLQEAAENLVEAARSGRLTSAQMSGGTFTLSNLGPYGIAFFTPILNPPESAILGVGRAEQHVVLVDGAVQAGWRLPLSLTIDHRVIDGAPAARFLQTVCRLLAEPEGLV